jgi:hypothetical protein
VLDEKGNVKSANYGKIYGDFMNFRYCFNPEVNSRNVEFDPKQNLLKGLKSTEQVDAPSSHEGFFWLFISVLLAAHAQSEEFAVTPKTNAIRGLLLVVSSRREPRWQL